MLIALRFYLTGVSEEREVVAEQKELFRYAVLQRKKVSNDDIWKCGMGVS